MVQLLSIAPKTMAEDEQVIAKGYVSSKKWLFVYSLTPLVTAYFFETKWVVAAGFFWVSVFLVDAGDKLYDLCIRVKRTNELLFTTSKTKLDVTPE